jgi:transcriptional regulator with XRE-family HTH domain
VVSAAQRSFGRRLRDQRERAGITLGAIADATKIKRSLLEELERGDLSTWPGGIFRRAFVRSYATAIGLPPESVVEEFVQMFPESGAADRAADPGNELRLTLVVDPWRRIAASITNVIAAIVEAGAIVAVAWLAAWISAASVWSACAVISLAYYALSAACLGRSPAAWYLRDGLPSFSHRRPTRRSQTAHARELIHLVQRRERAEDQIHDDPTARTASPEPLRAASR